MIYLDKPAIFKGKWYIYVCSSRYALYLRKDLTIQEYTYTNNEDEPNNGYWDTEESALEAMEEYYKINGGRPDDL